MPSFSSSPTKILLNLFIFFFQINNFRYQGLFKILSVLVLMSLVINESRVFYVDYFPPVIVASKILFLCYSISKAAITYNFLIIKGLASLSIKSLAIS